MNASKRTGMVPVVDLFSGPGGLAEGFAGYRDREGQTRFRVALSVENDKSAHETLRLRAFLRKFPASELPPEYHDFLNDWPRDEPNWQERYPDEWCEAVDETTRLTLGTPEANAIVARRISAIRRDYGDDTILLGGPPCQSYSLVGRARNVGNAAYDANKDKRQWLYVDYARVLESLQPAVAIMENVKGMLSARHQGKRIFHRVMKSLRDAGAKDRYRLYPLAPQREVGFWKHNHDPKDFVVRAEEYGIPQARHRVFVVCVRRDLTDLLPLDTLLRLERSNIVVTVLDMIGRMPVLRSRLSRGDNSRAWQTAILSACDFIRQVKWPEMSRKQAQLFEEALAITEKRMRKPVPPYGNAVGGTALACPRELRDWIRDERLRRLPNNETRGHIPEDLARYLFAAAFAQAKGKSPKAPDFPPELAPKHANWGTGKFGDRFRVQLGDHPCKTVTSHISKDGHYFIHPDSSQCRSLTVREVARLQTFPDNYFFYGGRTQQYVQVGNAVPPYLARQIAECVGRVLEQWTESRKRRHVMTRPKRASNQ